MDEINSFINHCKHIIKLARQKSCNPDTFPTEPEDKAIAQQLATSFNKAAAEIGEVAHVISHYWLLTGGNSTLEQIDRLAFMLAFVKRDSLQEKLNCTDMQELCDIIKENAQTIDIDLLSSFMSMMLEHDRL